MTARRPLPIAWRLVPLAALLAAVLSACGLPAVLPATAGETEPIVTDTGKFTATYAAPTSGQAAALSQEAALQRAQAVLPGSAQASSVQARRMLMTLEAENGSLAATKRDTWLVKYQGLAYKPNLGCDCYAVTWPDTTVALDAQTGDLLFIFGSGTR